LEKNIKLFNDKMWRVTCKTAVFQEFVNETMQSCLAPLPFPFLQETLQVIHQEAEEE